MIILDGASLASQRLEALRLQAQHHPDVHLAIIRIGEDAASRVYVQRKLQAAERIGFTAREHVLDVNTTQSELHDYLTALSSQPEVHALLLQLPLPGHLSTEPALEHIAPHKDADSLHPINMGRLLSPKTPLLPCTPKGILTLLEHYNIQLQGADVLVFGRSRIVGLPLSLLMMQQGATVRVCHRSTKAPETYLSQADIVVSATGTLDPFQAERLKPGSTLIDVGILRSNGHVRGDITHSRIPEHIHAYTPVPGGVGPMTVASLMENVWLLYEAQLTQPR